ncbi:hydroxymethylbilane synthase [Numidum massiliense]|uniref:hydroxymethylbilane synthase n=1 Tax=Numidum massiliense TaxID=1522315 RepID=UPI0006D57020|nr:hydroxymethylbilane synthase [Numidum massiliense]
MNSLTIGTRQSALALTQTEWVMGELRGKFPHLKLGTKKIVTKGDKILHVTLSKVGGKGLFVKEIEQALLDGEIDVAVHSMKDMPAQLADGLTLAAICKREDPRDCFISKTGQSLDELPEGAIVGTSSLRRQAQIQHYRPDLQIKPVRGNIDTRLRKLREGEFDAIILAAAGLIRLGWEDVITHYLDVDVSLPAVGQGAIGLECRADDEDTQALLVALNDADTARAVSAERAFLHRLNGSCQIPIGAYARIEQEAIALSGLVGDPADGRIIQHAGTGSDPVQLGVQLADALIAQGADEILASLANGNDT